MERCEDNSCLELCAWHWRLSSWKALVQSAGSLWATRDILLVFTGKATLDVSTLFPKYNAHRLDAGADHAWVDDTGLYVRILCFRIGGHGVIVWMVVLISRGSTTRLACVGYMLPSENWRRVLRRAIAKDRDMLKESYPHVLIGTPGRACGTRI